MMRVELDCVSKSFLGCRALDDITLTIEPGSLVAVVGVNGAGKSTLLRCLATLLYPTRGQIKLDGELLRRSRLDLRKRLHFVPDDVICMEHLDCVEQIIMTLEAYEHLPEGIEKTVSKLLHEMTLDNCEFRAMSTLSRGQRFKTVLVALFALERELWLIDEPFASGMDPIGQRGFRKYAREATSRGSSVIYSTQLADIAENFADKILILNAGKLLAFGTMGEIQFQVANSLGTTSTLSDVVSKLSERSDEI